MKNFFGLIIATLLLINCKTIQVNNNAYSVSESKIEFLAIGESKSIFGLKHQFEILAFPKVEEPIKLEISILPYTKKLSKIYLSKLKYNQELKELNYVDSLALKPELVKIKIQDISQLISSLNEKINYETINFVKNNQRTSIITSILLHLDENQILKIRECDTYYLKESQPSKYVIVLYKDGKKINEIDISNSTTLGHSVSKFCWGENQKGKWQIFDIIEKGRSCKGESFNKIKKRKEKSLYKM
jgi:hypothetical protein